MEREAEPGSGEGLRGGGADRCVVRWLFTSAAGSGELLRSRGATPMGMGTSIWELGTVCIPCSHTSPDSCIATVCSPPVPPVQRVTPRTRRIASPHPCPATQRTCAVSGDAWTVIGESGLATMGGEVSTPGTTTPGCTTGALWYTCASPIGLRLLGRCGLE